jgi:hypothetical protein
MRKALSWICVIWNGGWLLLGSFGLLFNLWWNAEHPLRSYAPPLLPIGLLLVIGPMLNIATAMFGARLVPKRRTAQRTAETFD